MTLVDHAGASTSVEASDEREDAKGAEALAAGALPDEWIGPHDAGNIATLPPFIDVLQSAGSRAGASFAGASFAGASFAGASFERLPHDYQNALIARRLRQLVELCRTSPLWAARIDGAVGKGPVTSLEAFQAIPPTDKDIARLFYTGDRPGMVVPIAGGGFQVATSGGTASGQPTEIVYPLDELSDTYRWAGAFIGRHIVNRHMPAGAARWVTCTLADHMMWSSSSMVGGVLQAIPGINYIGAGAIDANVFGRILAYPGSKAIMGISRSVADLVAFAEHVPAEQRATLRIALYGSGALQPKVHADLKALYPNLAILSFFAAMQAETIGLQLDPASPVLTAIPGLHHIEIVDEENRAVGVGEEGDLLVTRLFGNGAPVLRYRLGDRVLRHPDLVSPELNAMRFEYVGRSGDHFPLAGFTLYAPRVRTAVAQALREAGIVDLETVAEDVQIRVDHGARRLRIVASVETIPVTDPQHAKRAILTGLARAASLPVTEESLNRLRGDGFRFDLALVRPGSPELHVTEVGKTPLLVERH